MKPLYSEQSRDPKKVFTIQRCSPKRGEIFSCTHVPAIQCTHIKAVPSLLVRDSSGGRAISHDSFSSFLYFMIFLDFLYRYMYISLYQLSDSLPSFIHPLTHTRCAHYDSNLQTDWNLVISLKHCSHDWETNKTLSTWYGVKFMRI